MPTDITLLNGINTLRAVREFKPDPIPKDRLEMILEAASKAASGSNTQPWEFIVVPENESPSDRAHAQNLARTARRLGNERTAETGLR